MKAIKLTVVFVLFFGGLLLTASSCEAFSLSGMAVGLAMILGCALLSNLWEKEVCD